MFIFSKRKKKFIFSTQFKDNLVKSSATQKKQFVTRIFVDKKQLNIQHKGELREAWHTLKGACKEFGMMWEYDQSYMKKSRMEKCMIRMDLNYENKNTLKKKRSERTITKY